MIKLPDINDPKFDPLEVLKEFQEWSLSNTPQMWLNKKMLRWHGEASKFKKIEQLMKVWVRKRYEISKSNSEQLLDDEANLADYIEIKYDESQKISKFVKNILELWRVYYEITLD